MKNNFKKLVTIFILNFIFFTEILANDFNFKISELEILDNGNIFKGIKGGTVKTNDGMEIISENFTYNKSKNKLEAQGNVIVIDTKKDIILNSNKIIYLKDKEKIFTKGKTKVNVKNKYFIDTKNLIMLREDNYLSSSDKTLIKDTLSNIYNLDEFHYSIENEILKGSEIEVITNFNKAKSDTYFFKLGFLDLKNKNFLAKDVEVDFDKKLFGNSKNDPRLKGVSGYGDEYNTFLNKGTFTTCEKTDKCPPWIIESNNVRHDKIKKQIIYKNAWLKVYDTPVLYYPTFFHPDPTVKRQSGFLKPNLVNSTALGSGLLSPYFFAIKKDRDLTLKPRVYDTGTFVLQNEYRQKTLKTKTIADFSYTNGYKSPADPTKASRSHLFINTDIDLELENFIDSDLQIQFQKVTNDSYIKVFDLESPLLLGDSSTSESSIKLDLEDEDYNFTTSIIMFEDLATTNDDKFQYVLPSYSFSKGFNLNRLDGGFNFNSSGNNIIKEDIMSTSVTNDLNYISYNSFSDSGIKNNFSLYLKNLNTLGKNDPNYKASPQSEIMSAYMFNSSIPLIKKNLSSLSTLEPKLSLRFSPHEMKNHKNDKTRIDISNIYNMGRLGMSDSFEEGLSLTTGIDYTKQRLTNKKSTKQIEDFFEMKLATITRFEEEKNISSSSSLNKKSSNIFGEINYSLSEYVSLKYDFALDNDFKTPQYNAVETTLSFNNFSTEFSYLKEMGELGSANIIENRSSYILDENNSLLFNTRRNGETNLTEYYDLIYKYKNDCLTAGLQYRKSFYSDNELKPSKNLLFTITIVPLGSFAPENILK